MNLEQDIFYMKRALELAKIAANKGDVPVGALIVHDGAVIAEGYNSREADKNPLGHAEINAIAAASNFLKSKRISGTIYVTLEPCPMCTGAILESFLDRLVFGASDPKLGACGSVMNIADYPGSCRRVKVVRGVLEKESSELLSNFFKKLRRRDG